MKNISHIKNFNNKISPRLELDHIYLMASKCAPEIQLFKENGFFITDIITRQPGFGTSGRVLYFHNFYIEFRWIEDENVYMKSILPLYKNKNEGLFKMKMGVTLFNKNIIDSTLPFSTKNYFCEWMKPGSYLKAVEIENELTPQYFILPNYMAFKKDRIKRIFIKPLLNHGNKIKRLSNVKMFFEGRDLNEAEKYLKQFGIIDYQAGNGNYIELEFDKNKKGKEINLIKELSTIIKY